MRDDLDEYLATLTDDERRQVDQAGRRLDSERRVAMSEDFVRNFARGIVWANAFAAPLLLLLFVILHATGHIIVR